MVRMLVSLLSDGDRLANFKAALKGQTGRTPNYVQIAPSRPSGVFHSGDYNGHLRSPWSS
jgi:hypothetical protein